VIPYQLLSAAEVREVQELILLSSYIFPGTENSEMNGKALFTVIVAVTDLAKYVLVAACVAVMVAVPNPAIVIVVPEILATDVLEVE